VTKVVGVFVRFRAPLQQGSLNIIILKLLNRHDKMYGTKSPNKSTN
jgi:hypothetical protein